MEPTLEDFQTIGILMYHGRETEGWCTRRQLLIELNIQGINVNPDFVDRLIGRMMRNDWIEGKTLYGEPAYRFSW